MNLLFVPLRVIARGAETSQGATRLDVRGGTGQQAMSSGQYLTVWRRDSSGHWLIIRNVVF
jgi:ketosteroid isomerase-like protein